MLTLVEKALILAVLETCAQNGILNRAQMAQVLHIKEKLTGGNL